MSRSFQRVGVLGLGTMGAGIAEVLARAGVDVIGVEADEASLERGRDHLRHSTDRAVLRGKITEEEQKALLARITGTTDLATMADRELIIEAVPERMDLKTELFRKLDEICPEDTILATNTSALSVTALAASTTRPDRVIGMHWFNPAPVMGLVEIVSTVVTGGRVVEDMQALANSVGKNGVLAGDRAGFIANALLFGYLNNAAKMLEARYASREDIDAAMRLGAGHPMGPLALLDLIGLDSAYEILETMYRQSRDHLHAPAPILKQLVTAGFLGRKSGRGFYTYAEPDSSKIIDVATPTLPEGVSPRPVRRIGVIGSGTMAAGMAQVCASRGMDVVLRARTAEKATAAIAGINKSLGRSVAKGRMTEDEQAAAVARITPTGDLTDLANCDLIIEAVVEDLAVKQALFAELSEICGENTVLATTTSSLPVIACASASRHPENVIGMHWFNPAPAMKLVEVVPTVRTSDEVTATVHAVCEQVGKHAVSCGDRAGFIVNALLFPYLNDAVKMLDSHYATVEDIDMAMTTGCGHPMGPFALMDVVGLDVTLAIQRVLYNEFREPGYAPAPLLEHLVTAGYLGRKTGRGFKDYS
jgi:3-hydroxybutyryl-CoA dehydrogenase